MEKTRVVYPNFEGERAKQGLTISDCAKAINCTVSTMCNKLKGYSDFTFGEAIALKAFVSSTLTLEELFAKRCE